MIINIFENPNFFSKASQEAEDKSKNFFNIKFMKNLNFQ